MPDNITDIQKSFDSAAAPLDKAGPVKHTFTLKELWDKKDEVQEFIIPDLLPKDAVAVLIGEDGIGKTQIMVQLCLAIALRKPTFLLLPLNVIHARSLVVATEDSKEKFIKAVAKQISYMTDNDPNFDPGTCNLEFTEAADFENLDKLCDELKRLLRLNPYDLLVLDALSDLVGLIDGDLNNSAHARMVLSPLQSICNEFKTTILIIHHAAKTKLINKAKEGKIFVEKGDSQGAGAITQKPRTVLALTHDPSSVRDNGRCYDNYLHAVKANLMTKYYHTNAIKVVFDQSNLIHTYSELTDIRLFESAGDGMTDPKDKSHAAVKPQGNDFTTIDFDAHWKQMIQVFGAETYLKYGDLAKRIKSVYDLSDNKIKSNDGLIKYLQKIELLFSGQLGYYLRVGEIPSQSDINFPTTETPTPTGDDTPF